MRIVAALLMLWLVVWHVGFDAWSCASVADVHGAPHGAASDQLDQTGDCDLFLLVVAAPLHKLQAAQPLVLQRLTQPATPLRTIDPPPRYSLS